MSEGNGRAILWRGFREEEGWNGNSYSDGDNNYGYWEWLSLT